MRVKTAEKRFREKIAPANAAGCRRWTASTNGWGYGRFRVGGRVVYAHRFAWELANGPIPDGLLALHRCDVPACCNHEHLFLGTDADNSADMVAKGRLVVSRGIHNGAAKLTQAQAVEVFNASGLHKDIAARYGICPSLVSLIKNRKNWSHATAGLAVPCAAN